MRALLEAERRRRRVPGLAACVVRPGEPPELLACGQADGPSGRAVSADTTFAWYSLTKLVTTLTAMALVADGRLDLDRPAHELVPELALTDPGARWSRAGWRPVTPRDLLSHGAGFVDQQVHVARWFREPDAAWPEPREFLAAALRRHGPRRAPPGARLRYSNLGFAVLGEVIADAAGRPFRDVVRALVLDPLGMDRTGFEGARILVGDHARGHLPRWSVMGLAAAALGRGAFTDGRHGRHHLVRWRDLVFSPHGGLLGPVGDLARLLSVFVSPVAASGAAPAPAPAPGPARASVPGSALEPAPGAAPRSAPSSARSWLPRASLDAMATPITRSRREACGLGWFVQPSPTGAGTLLRHGGRGPGFTTEMAALSNRSLAVGVLGNGAFDARAVGRALLTACVRC